MINLFFPKGSFWEEHYLKNEIFNEDNYNFNIHYIYFDNNTNISIFKHYISAKNIIIINRANPLNFIQEIISILSPFAIFHLSDEFCIDMKYYELYHDAKILFHQYNHNKIAYNTNHVQIPLGYVKHFLSNKPSSYNFINYKFQDRKYMFSFIGSLKQDREEMLSKFKNAFESYYIHIGYTNWNNPSNQEITPTDMFNIYNNTLFIPIGRGNSSLDCFRLYEAIVSNAIPIIVGNMEEINNTFNFNGDTIPNLIIGKDWDEAVKICQELYINKDKIQNILNMNKKWWNSQHINIISKITTFASI